MTYPSLHRDIEARTLIHTCNAALLHARCKIELSTDALMTSKRSGLDLHAYPFHIREFPAFVLTAEELDPPFTKTRIREVGTPDAMLVRSKSIQRAVSRLFDSSRKFIPENLRTKLTLMGATGRVTYGLPTQLSWVFTLFRGGVFQNEVRVTRTLGDVYYTPPRRFDYSPGEDFAPLEIRPSIVPTEREFDVALQALYPENHPIWAEIMCPGLCVGPRMGAHNHYVP